MLQIGYRVLFLNGCLKYFSVTCIQTWNLNSGQEQVYVIFFPPNLLNSIVVYPAVNKDSKTAIIY